MAENEERKSKVMVDVITMFNVTPRLKFFSIAVTDPDRPVCGDETAHLTRDELLEVKEDAIKFLAEIESALTLEGKITKKEKDDSET